LDAQQAKTVLATTREEVPTLASAIQTTTHRIEVLRGPQPGALQKPLTSGSL
jgi:outer membrane protein TolC